MNKKDIFSQIDHFFKSDYKNIYVSDDLIKIYLRKSKRLFNDLWYDCIDFANIEVQDPKNYGKGIFTRVLTTFLEKFPDKNIFVESILNEHLSKKLLSFNFTEIKTPYQLDMILIKNNYI